MSFASKLSPDTAKIGGIGRLEIQVANVDISVQWFKNGEKMEDNSQLLKFEMVVQGTLRALIIKNCVASDFGKYEVLSGEERAETIFREESETPAAAPVSEKRNAAVAEEPKKAENVAVADAVVIKNVPQKVFAQDIQDAEAREGQIAVFETKLAADLPVQWFFRGNEITKEKYSILKFEAVATGLLRKLIVKNIAAEDFQRFSISCEGQIQNAELKKQAVFKKSLKDVTGHQTEIQLLKCTLNSSLPAKWFFGDKEINKDNFSILKFEAREDKNNVRTLIIKNIRSQDYGQYSVEVSGERASCSLLAPFPFVSKVRDAEGPRGGIARFELMVLPNTEVTWFLGKTPISPENFSILKYESSNRRDVRQLLIKNINDDDYNMYVIGAEANGYRCNARVIEGPGIGQSRFLGKETAPKRVVKDAPEVDYDSKPTNGTRGVFGLKVPTGLSEKGIKEFVLQAAKERDMELGRKWVRNGASFCRNPSQA